MIAAENGMEGTVMHGNLVFGYRSGSGTSAAANQVTYFTPKHDDLVGSNLSRPAGYSTYYRAILIGQNANLNARIDGDDVTRYNVFAIQIATAGDASGIIFVNVNFIILVRSGVFFGPGRENISILGLAFAVTDGIRISPEFVACFNIANAIVKTFRARGQKGIYPYEKHRRYGDGD
jgi:hypothetical protein